MFKSTDFLGSVSQTEILLLDSIPVESTSSSTNSITCVSTEFIVSALNENWVELASAGFLSNSIM